jgi:endonuclease-3
LGKKETLEEKRARLNEILARLKSAYPGAECALEHENAFELMVATILSAQCTDARVNMVTPALFRKYPDARAMAKARLADVEKLIQSTGFYKNKAKSLVESAKLLVERHEGEVPKTMEALTALRGVGRKTANVILGNAFGLAEGIVVDTHVGRLSRRLGLTKHVDPVKVEQDLVLLLPREEWTLFSHLLIFHGRSRCIARLPDCLRCEVRALCPRVGVTKSTEAQ